MLSCFHFELVNFVLLGHVCKLGFAFIFALAMLFPFNELVNCFLLETLARLVLSHSLLL